MPRWLQSLLDLLSRWTRPKPQPPPPSPPPSPPPAPTNPNQYVNELLAAHNKERKARGAGRLRLQTSLLTAAQNHAQWMSDNQKMSHTGENRSSVGTRVRNSGYNAMSVGENIAAGYSTVESVMRGWMNSSGHRSNILRKQYIDCGFAKVGRYWCAVFASPIALRDSRDALGFEEYQASEFCPEPLEGSEE